MLTNELEFWNRVEEELNASRANYNDFVPTVPDLDEYDPNGVKSPSTDSSELNPNGQRLSVNSIAGCIASHTFFLGSHGLKTETIGR